MRKADSNELHDIYDVNYLNIDDKKLIPEIAELHVLLADHCVYHEELRSFHWNVLGKNLYDLRNMFEELYGDARIKIDELTEHILTL